MLRGLYRVYLYVVAIAMLLFAAYGLNDLLYSLLLQTPLKGHYETAPGRSALVQGVVFAVIALLTAALVGGVHYWLIRRDIRSDAAAASSGIRSFFLNFVEAIYLLLAVGTSAFALPALGVEYSSGIAGAAAFAIPAFFALALLDWERRRSPARAGAASIFQRLHLYGVQLILLFMLTVSWFSTVGQLFDSLFFAGRGTHTSPCGGFTTCPDSGPNLLSLALVPITFALFWYGYSLLSRKDTSSLIRRVLHLISLGYGIIFVLLAVYRGMALLMLTLFKVPISVSDFSGPNAPYDVLSPLSLGALVVVFYTFQLRQAAKTSSSQTEAIVSLTARSIAAALLGATFWYGCGRLIFDLLERAAPSTTPLTSSEWAATYAILIAGIAYIPLDIYLRRRSEKLGITAPLRGFVFTLLGAGILALAIGGATALYAFGTYLLSSPLPDWLYVAHRGSAACAVGVAVVGIYLSISLRERFFGRARQRRGRHGGESLAPSTDGEAPVEGVDRASPAAPHAHSPIAETIDALLAGRISRAEAIASIEALLRSHA